MKRKCLVPQKVCQRINDNEKMLGWAAAKSRDRRDNGASGDGATIVDGSWLETMRFKIRA